MIDMGPISFHLRLKIEQNQENRTIKLFKRAYINKIFNKFHLNKANAVNTLMKETTLLQPRIKGEAIVTKKKNYQQITGSIMFSMVETKPDIFFANSVAC